MGGNRGSSRLRTSLFGNYGTRRNGANRVRSSKTTFETLAKLFFEIHDPTQTNRQGPDIGEQYRSAVFFTSDKQRIVVEKLMETLKKKGLSVVTKLEPAGTFWESGKLPSGLLFQNGKSTVLPSARQAFRVNFIARIRRFKTKQSTFLPNGRMIYLCYFIELFGCLQERFTDIKGLKISIQFSLQQFYTIVFPGFFTFSSQGIRQVADLFLYATGKPLDNYTTICTAGRLV